MPSSRKPVIDIAQRLAAGPPLAFAATKKAINAATLSHLEEALERERTGQAILLRTDDVAEGMRGLLRKSPTQLPRTVIRRI